MEGNHDVIAASEFKALGIQVVEKYVEEVFYFSHFPMTNENHFVFCGHVHPGVKLKGAGLQRLSSRVFKSTAQLILPAFGAFTGLHLLKAKSGDHIYVTTGKEVVEFREKTLRRVYLPKKAPSIHCIASLLHRLHKKA